MMHNPQATANLKTKVVRKSLPLEKSQLLHAKTSDGVVPGNKIGNNISNSTQILSSLLHSGTLDQPVEASNMQASLLTSASDSEINNSTLMTSVTPSDNLLQHILTGSLTAKTEKLGVKPSTTPTGNVKLSESGGIVVPPKVKPVLPDGIPELLLSKITLLEMVSNRCTQNCCVCLHECVSLELSPVQFTLTGATCGWCAILKQAQHLVT